VRGPKRWAVTLAPIFAITGFSALVLQVVWQRVISLHSGVDLSSTTTVVAAFLGGLGVGNLLGGRLADRLGPTRSLTAFAAANVGIGLFAWLSLLLFYDLYREFAGSLQSTAATFAFNAAILLVPTTLMGLSLPLVARAVTATVEDAGRVVGRLYGINTIGAAAGAAVAGWFLLGTFGFVVTTRIAGTLNLVAAALVLLMVRSVAPSTPAHARGETHDATMHDATMHDATMHGATTRRATPHATPPGARVWPWFVVYGVTGAVALGFEQVFFRLIDAVMRSNSYSFAHVLTLYLVLFGLGSALSSRLVGPGRDPRRWFLTLQALVGLSALFALVMLVVVAPKVGFESRLDQYFLGDGYNSGFGLGNGWREWAKISVIYVVVPVGLMGLPVLFMGASFPFVQALVADRVETLGRRTGALLFANICGNVAGTLIVGFVLLDAVGTAGTYRILTLLLGAVGLGAVALAPTSTRRRAEGAALVGALVVVLAASPSNDRLWAFLHGADDDRVDVAEGHSCAAALRFTGEEAMLTVNGSSQNAHPFDDFHILIGLVPVLAHADPERTLAIGMGAGSTTFAMLQDPRVDHVVTVELCGEQYELLHALAAAGRVDFQRMFADPRYDPRTGDGRKFLLAEDERYDVITVDTLRPTSAFSGSLYSEEFYELISDRLAENGLLAQWVPSGRVPNTVASVFPYVTALTVPTYNDSTFLVAGNEPFDVSTETLAGRFAAVPDESFAAPQRASLGSVIAESVRRCIADGRRAAGLPSDAVNHDLRPRDEYFMNNDRTPPELVSC
jgi:spermidine synthase